jgi:hypothetical protein
LVIYSFKKNLQALAASMHKRLYRILSQHGNNFIAGFTYGQATIKFWQFFHGHPTKRSACAERISSLAEPMRKHFNRRLSQRDITLHMGSGRIPNHSIYQSGFPNKFFVLDEMNTGNTRESISGTAKTK